jgi:hypothetical protein
MWHIICHGIQATYSWLGDEEGIHQHLPSDAWKLDSGSLVVASALAAAAVAALQRRLGVVMAAAAGQRQQ